MPSASSDTRKLNLAFVAELIAEGATEATLPTALAKIRDRYPVISGGDKAINKLHSARRKQVAIQLILALKIENRYKLGALYPEFSSFLPKMLKAKPSAAVEGSNNNSPEPVAAAVAALAAASAPLAPMSPEEAYKYRTGFPLKVLEELAEQYAFKDIVAVATGRHLRITQKDEQRAYARLALDYESATSEAEKARLLKRIHYFLLRIVEEAYIHEWNSYKLKSMFALKYILEKKLKLTGLPSIEGIRDTSIDIESVLEEPIIDQIANLEIQYTIAMSTATDTAPIIKEIHELLIILYKEAVYNKRMRQEKYGNPNVNSPTLEKVNTIYAQRLANIEDGSGSPETQKRRINALLQGQKTHFQAPRWAGTKCDKMLGFAQHSGECATDAVQQILLFADPWKNKIQPLVYDLTDATIEDLYAALTAGPAPHPDRTVLRSLLLNLQKRFQNHYTTLQLLSHEEECVPQFDYRRLLTEAATEGSFAGLSLRQKKKLSGELGPSLKRELTTLLPSKHVPTSTNNIIYVLTMMFRLFGISYVRCNSVFFNILDKRQVHRPEFLSTFKGWTHLAFWLSLRPYHPLRPWIEQDRDGHAAAIYYCESIWYYYDNNKGIIKLHPRLMEDLLNEVTLKWYIGMGYIGDEFEFVFYKIPHFDTLDIDSTKRIHYWDFATQSWTPCLYKRIIDRHSRQFFHFNQCIHIMTDDHRHTGYTSPYLQTEYVLGSPTERPESKSKSKSRKSPTFAERALLKRIAALKNVNNTERALKKRIQNLKNVNNTEKALLARIRSLTRKKSRSTS